MNPKLPLKGVTLRKVDTPRKVEAPLSENEFCQISQHEFAMQVEGVGDFYVSNGSLVEYVPSGEADPDWVNIYLNGQILAVLMHQRKIINFHGSSFIYKEKGIMVLGETGAGKSSLTAAFTLDGAGFLSDDFTPVLSGKGKSLIWPVNKGIKLHGNTIQQLGIRENQVRKTEKVTGKYFLDVEKAQVDHYGLEIILKIEIGDKPSPDFSLPDPSEKFSLLRSEVCSWEMLAGMPDTEAAYLQQLLEIVMQVKIVKVIRPKEITIPDLYHAIVEYLGSKSLSDPYIP
jgi:hypothetical protein